MASTEDGLTPDQRLARGMTDDILRREIQVADALPAAYLSSKRFAATARAEQTRRKVMARLMAANPSAGKPRA